ncbi:MAG: SHOCT domain-containing protein [Anaerolineae bacterium]|nr:SHOCT domain-containing protein [Anaerolineae bacterium]
MIRLLLGIGLMALSFIVLVMVMVESPNPMMTNVMTSLVCQPGETFVQEVGGTVNNSFNRPAGRSLAFYCENNEGQQRDVTGQAIGMMVAGFAVPFVAGLLLTIWGVYGMMRRAAKRTFDQPADYMPGFGSSSTVFNMGGNNPVGTPTVITADSGPMTRSGTVVTVNGKQVSTGDLPPETARIVNQLLGGMSSMMGDASQWTTATDQNDLTDKLQQLQEARDKGLISTEEYDRLRRTILDSLK